MLSTSQTQARKPVKFAVSALTMAIFLVTFIASPAQADDLEIYQPAVTGGGKTLILMLDAAGQMNSGGNLDKVVAGLQNLLKTDDPAINTVAIGLGHYNSKNDSGGSNTSGDIVVPAATLGTLASSLPNSSGVPTTGQRKTLWDMVIAGSGNGSSQVAAVQDPAIPGHTFTFAGNGPASPVQGYAEAAAYLMGTTTAPTINSGFSASISTSKTGTHYNSPLSNTGACGGTGLYFLTSGQFVSTNAAESDVIFNAALTPVGGVTPTSVSSCAMGGYAATPGLAAVNNAPWNCMASFAQQLYDPSKNPAGAQIKTAFVGFGSNFASLGDSAAINTCHIGSKLKGDLCSPDAATAANRNPTGGYGNGGFYAVNSPADVTTSVKNFILTLGGNTVTPLVTGAASIPIDTLNPNGFQSYGYLRMIAPNPGQPATMLWKGDLKKYALSGGALVSNGSTTNFVLNTVGQLNTNTTDNWNAVAANDVAAGTGDGGIIDQGGAYPKVPMPYGVVTNATTTPPTQDLTYQNKIRPLFTDVGAVTPALPYLVSTSGTTNTTTGITHDFTDTLSSVSSNALLTPVKPKDSSGTLATNLIDTIPQMFDSTNTTISSGSPLKSLSIVQKKKLINYLGFPLPIYGADDAPLVATRYGTCTGGATPVAPATNCPVVFSAAVAPATTPTYYADPVPVPSKLTLPTSPYLAMGGSVHAQPIQLTYSANADLTGRVESVLYGSMEGALHMVNAATGVEQMAFVPAEILADDVLSRALQVDAENKSSSNVDDLRTPAQGVDGPWVADAAYGITKTTTGTGTTAVTTSALVASRMRVYGGMRLGGTSYYGLDLLTKTADVVTPRLLFRITNNSTFDRMGKTFAKPVLANVRIAGTITRVMIVGGGYDTGYESPSFTPSSTTPALGNTVYIVNAQTGALIWKASTSDNANLIHSVAARVSPVDRDGDGLIDSIYFADLGGQVFRADFNNANSTAASTFPVRVTRLANLATSASGTAITDGTNPRFFEAPTVTVNDYGSTTFALVTVASGNRSSPLDVLDTNLGGRALRTLPVNKVYGIIDRDLVSPSLLQSTYTVVTHDKTLNDLQLNPQTLSSTTVIPTVFFPAGTGKKDGWYRSLTSKSDGTDYANGTFRYPGGLKAYEEQIALTGKLYVPVYDPQGTGVSGSSCAARVVGETDLQTYCLPYGVCVVASGSNKNMIDTTAEANSGVKFTNGTSSDSKNANVIGPGIRGISLGANSPTTAASACNDFTLVGNQSGTSNWSCNRKLVPTLWYDKQPNRSKVQ